MRRGFGFGFGGTVAAMAVAGVVTTAAVEARAASTLSGPLPAAGTVVGDSVSVEVSVQSPYVVASVTAKVGAATTDLTALPGGRWRGALNVGGEPIGPATLTFAAHDASGDTSTLDVSIIHDHAPQIAILTPSFVVARPNVNLNATCSDTDVYGCASITVSARGPVTSADPGAGKTMVLATAVGAAIHQTVSLSAYEGMPIRLVFTATDAAGANTTQEIPAFVESSPHLVLVEEIDGNVLDVDATRVLFVSDSGVYVKNRTSGVVTRVGDGTPTSETTGHLSSTGAAWTNGDWIGGVTTARTTPLARARGDWAVRQPPLSSGPIVRENLATGGTASFPVTSIYHYGDIDSAGTVAYSRYNANGQNGVYELHRITTADVDELVSTSGLPLNPVDPIVDGGHIVWHAHASSAGNRPIVLSAGADSKVLDPSYAALPYFTLPYQAYRANDGWIAYEKVVGGTWTAWTRSPAGVEALAGPFSGVLEIVGLGPTGEIVYDVGTPGTTPARWTSAATAAGTTKPLDIGGATGEMRWLSGSWYEQIGRDVFHVDPNGVAPGADGGQADAAADATTSDGGAPTGPGATGSSDGAAEVTSPPPAETNDDAQANDADGGCATIPAAPAPFGSALLCAAAAMAAALRRANRRVR